MGLDVGDEYVGKDGISSWMMAVDDKFNPFSGDQLGRSRRNLRWDHLIMVVRDIKDAVPSVIVENRHAPNSFAFRQKWVKKIIGADLADCGDEITAAIGSIVSWSQIILDQKPVLQFRIEDQQHLFREYVASVASRLNHNINIEDVKVNAAKLYGGVRPKKPAVDPTKWDALAPEVKRKVVWYSETFGYKSPVALDRSAQV